MSKKNKSLIALLLVLCIGLVGLTVAYFSNSTTMDNEFQSKEYGTTYTEKFVSPDNWLPGDTTDKIVTVTNSGQVDEAVRISLSESWTPNNSNESLTGWIHTDGTKSNHTTEEELSTDVRTAVINFTNPSEWTKVGDYYYYNYKLVPGQTTDSLIESVTFNALTKLGDTCTSSSENGKKTIICNSSGSDYDNATYKLTINVETVQYNKYQEAWNTGNTVSLLEPPKPAIEYLAENATNATNDEYSETTKKKMFQFTHTINGDIINESRYIGDAPNNYVYFNCDTPQKGVEYNYADACEVWRIIGVFDVEKEIDDLENEGQKKNLKETRLKLVRGDLIKNYQWDTHSKNDWTIATLKTYLNEQYYNSLKTSAKEMIDEAKYYLGSCNYYKMTTEQLYAAERGTTLCGACGNDTSKLKWQGNVGLMYPSDEYMVYGNGVNNSCYSNPAECRNYIASTGWIYNSNTLNGSIDYTWLLSSYFDTVAYSLLVYSNGNLGPGSGVYNGVYGVRPVIYLKSDIKISRGTGEIENPYVLK